MTKVQDELTYLLTKVRRQIGFVASIFVTLVAGSSVFGSTVSGDISQIGDATHIEFKGRSNWNYGLTQVAPNKVKVKVPAFDSLTETKLKSWNDALIEKVEINKSGPDGQYEVIFTTSSEGVESFDYLTDEPSRFIIDFFLKQKEVEIGNSEVVADNPSNQELPTKSQGKKLSSQSSARKVLKEGEYEKKNRKIASSEILKVGRLQGLENVERLRKKQGAYDGGDPSYQRFRIKDYEISEESIIASKQNIYIKFPMLKLETSRLAELIENPPEYIIKPTETKENKEARFLMTLYENKRYAAFLKTYDYFLKQYPDSIYDEIVRNLAADVHRQLWQRDGSVTDYNKFQSTMEYLVNQYPDSVLTERLELILAYSALERKDGVQTIQRFMKFLSKYKDSSHKDQAKKALVSGFLLINKYKEAMQALQELEKTATDKISGIEGHYREGDVSFQEGNYQQSISSYQQAIKNFPANEKDFPNANYNLAEAYFWQGEYKKSLEHYVRFVELFPAHSHGSYALTRIGEVLDILGANKSKVMGAFLESYYRYQKSEGSEIARIRMLSQKMMNMKEREMNKSLKEMGEIAKNSKLPRMEEFTTLMVADGLHGRKEYEKALEYLISYYQRNPTSADFTFFKGRILKNISDLIYKKIQDSDFIGVLSLSQKYATTWLKNADRIDLNYFIARAYEMAGVHTDALNFYLEIQKKLSKIVGTREHLERKVNEHLPSLDEIYLRIAAVSTQKREYASAYQFLKSISTKDQLSGPDQIEFVQLSSIISEKRGQIKLAKKYLRDLIDAWQGRPELLASVFVRLARLELATNELIPAEESIAEVERLKQAGLQVDKDVWYQTLITKGNLLEKNGRKVAAVETYQKLVDDFSSDRPVGSIRYKMGQILFNQGNIKGAAKVWSGLDEASDSMYVQLANEKLSSAKWEDDYKKYIQRIPAASEMNGRGL